MFNRLFLFLCLSLIVSCKEKDKQKEQPTKDEKTSELTEKSACLFSQISYCTNIDSALETYMPGWQLVWEGNEIGGNHAFLAKKENEYALAIRGSLINFSWAAFQNWIYQDLHVVTQEKWLFTNDSSKAKLSQGAYDGWQNLCKMTDKKSGKLLLDFLTSELKEDKSLLITGHSLGGNLATVFASYLWQVLKNKNHTAPDINTITFAAPAAGNKAFANDFNYKFPASIRVENINDIVPKFPSASRIASLNLLFSDSLSAGKIEVGYKNMTVSLSTVFTMLKTALVLLEYTSGISPYLQTNGTGKQINIPLSGKNSGNEILNWLGEAGHQHGIAQYALYEGVPVINCEK
ncbi:MAG: lipase family protein [Chitinophagaceae bacterium]